MTQLTSLFADFDKALSRLQEVLAMPKNGVVRDSAIKRFEIVFDLAWKTLKAFLEQQHNVQCVSPKTCFREAYNKGVIEDYENFWLTLADMRNETAHTYREDTAEKVYAALPRALDMLGALAKKLRSDIEIK